MGAMLIEGHQDRLNGQKAVLLTVSGTIPKDVCDQIASGRRPRADYIELAKGLDADILDYAAGRRAAGWLGAALGRLAPDLVLAVGCWRLRRRYRVIVTDGEQIGLLLALLLKLTPGGRPRHVMIVHVMSVFKKMFFLDWLGIQSRIDRFLVYSEWQRKFIEQRWKLGNKRVIRTPFMVDQNFFSPNQVRRRETAHPQICAVGLERRDYPTLLQAVKDLDIKVIIAAASPWSKYKDTSANQSIPDNVTLGKFSQYELRQVYADSRCLVMPLEPVDFQAGVTAILEAMAMAKPVICSRVPGQTDVVVEDENGRYVPPGDAAALRDAITSLLDQPTHAERLGSAGRELVEREMSLDHYVARLARIVRDTIDDDVIRD